MLSILTGLPVDKRNDEFFVRHFIDTDATKVICGSSTMKMFCRIQNITPVVNISLKKNIPIVKYKIKGIELATEGVITLNACYKFLKGKKTEKQSSNYIWIISYFKKYRGYFYGG